MVLPFLLISCSPRSEETTHSFRIYEEDGVTIAETTGGPKYEGELFYYEKEMEIRPDTSEVEALLYRPSYVTKDDEGNFYICDTGSREIVVYNRDGAYLARFGGEGSGPGEFRSLRLQGLINNNILQLYDPRLSRTTLYRTDGTLLGVFTVPAAVRPLILYPLGERIICIEQRNERRGSDSWRSLCAVIYNTEYDTVAVLDPPLSRCYRNIESETTTVGFPIYFSTYPKLGFLYGRGIHYFDTDLPDLHWYDLNGNVTHVYRIGLPKIEPSVDDKNEIRRIIDGRIVRSTGPLKDAHKLVKVNLAFGDFIPFWTSVTVDDAGYAWLELYEAVEQRDEAGGSAFRVLSPDGEYLGDTRWPLVVLTTPVMQYAAVVQGCLLTLEQDPDTNERVPTVYRILPAVEGLKYP